MMSRIAEHYIQPHDQLNPTARARMSHIIKAFDRDFEAKAQVVLSHAKTSRGRPLPFLSPDVV
jgi:hypothetical protein